MIGMGDPRTDLGFDFTDIDGAGTPAISEPAQPIAETTYVALGQVPSAIRQQHEAQKQSQAREQTAIQRQGAEMER